MFDPKPYKTYRYHSSMLFIDTKAKISEVKEAVPLFFSNARKGEKRTMYRGHIICQKTENFSNGPQLHISVFAFDVRGKDTYCIDTNAKSLELAKELIDNKLDTPEPNPLVLGYSEQTFTIEVKAMAAVFRDSEGKATNIELDKVTMIGKQDLSTRKPEDAFMTEVWDGVRTALQNS